VIGQGTNVAIIARGSGQGFVGAADFRVAEILGASVFIVAKEVVDLPVTIVVNTVTDFRLWDG